jgi:hypothetical protein
MGNKGMSEKGKSGEESDHAAEQHDHSDQPSKGLPAQRSAGCVCIHDISFLVSTPGSSTEKSTRKQRLHACFSPRRMAGERVRLQSA